MRVYVNIGWPNIIWCASSRITKVRCPIGPWVLHFDPWFYIGPWARNWAFLGRSTTLALGCKQQDLVNVAHDDLAISCHLSSTPTNCWGVLPLNSTKLDDGDVSWKWGMNRENDDWPLGLGVQCFSSGQQWNFSPCRTSSRCGVAAAFGSLHHVTLPWHPTLGTWPKRPKQITRGVMVGIWPTHDKARVWNRIQVWFMLYMLNPCFLGGIWYLGVPEFPSRPKKHFTPAIGIFLRIIPIWRMRPPTKTTIIKSFVSIVLSHIFIQPMVYHLIQNWQPIDGIYGILVTSYTKTIKN